MSIIGEAIAGAALSAFFGALFEKLASSELLSFATEAQARGEIKEWEKMLRRLHLVLEDAEEKQMADRLVKEWIGEVKHLAYDVEDILDEFATECLRRKVMGEPHAPSTSKIKKVIPACCTSFTPRAVMFNADMMSKIRDISAKLKRTFEEMKELNLVESRPKTSGRVWQRPPSTSLNDEPVVYGRDGDKDKILNLVLSYEIGDPKLGVIPIVAMGGMGKTTLAKMVYNDNSITNHFQAKAWVCVSDVFDILKVSKAILESITSHIFDSNELNQVHLKLNENLAGKKYVIVLDDVWTNNYDDWHALRSPLLDGAPGSKIIVTTRSTDVATMMGTTEYHDLKRISDDDCWQAFSKHAFENRSVAAHPNLEKIGREIVNTRCGGLPLAARTLGGLLRSKQRHDEWEEVLNSRLWSLLDKGSKIMSVLELSYYYLPSQLKRCFAYCAVLPKDYEFEQNEIILLWMAEGLIPPGKQDLGRNYFLELLSRSIFQASHMDNSRFIMHDLVNGLAQKVAEDTCVRLEDEVSGGAESKREKTRYFSYIKGDIDVSKRFAPVYKMKCLRTFLPMSLQRIKGHFLAKNIPHELLQNLRYLRVLCLVYYNIEELPDSIGKLKHLRYLDLSYTVLRILPDSITSLFNLQTLILRECKFLKQLPTRMDNLINLLHLDIRGATSIKEMPLAIKELRNLQTLSDFVLGDEGFTITALMSLKSLRGEICISNLDHVVSASDARKAKLMDKEGITVLELKWKHAAVDLQDEGVHYDVLDGLQPYKILKKLTISGYGGTRFPLWIGDPLFDNIVHLRLENCNNCTSLPHLGMLPSLKELFIIGLSKVRRVDQEFYGKGSFDSFPSLQVLYFQNMNDWEEWSASEFRFSVLRELCIERCGELRGNLPIHLSCLEQLVIKYCENLVISLPSLPVLSAVKIEKCKEVDFRNKTDFSSLNMIVLSEISTITNLAEGFMQRLKKFKTLALSADVARERYVSLFIFNLRRLDFGKNSTLECVVQNCPQLTSMTVNEDKRQMLMTLEESDIQSLILCGYEKLQLGGVPSKLTKLKILEWSSHGFFTDLIVGNRQTLQELEIFYCDFLTSFRTGELPPTLKKLQVRNCKKLKIFLEEDSALLPNLEYIFIVGCDSLTSITQEGKLPPRLQSLHIHQCHKLESIAERFDHSTSLEIFRILNCSSLKFLPDEIHSLVNLREFCVDGCPSIVSFPPGGLSTIYLRRLSISCPLPDNMYKLSSLQVLDITFCSALLSFPSQGLPSNLTSLTIKITNPKIYQALFEWGLDRLNSLQELRVYGECSEVLSFPPDEIGVMLPPALTTLEVGYFPSLEGLFTKGSRNLTSLQYLSIVDCPKLASFPDDGLPDSLLHLFIQNCPLLVQRCQEGKGPGWSKIANIPKVEYEQRRRHRLRPLPLVSGLV